MRVLGRGVLWQHGVLFPLLPSIAPKILMLMILVFGQGVMTLAVLTTLCGHVPVDLAIWISHLDRVKFSWLGLGGSFLVRLLKWIVFMLGLCLCNVEFGISGMALSAMSGPAHACSFVTFIFGMPSLFGFGSLLAGPCSGLLGRVHWVMALTCLVPVLVRCSLGGSSLKSFTPTSKFLPAALIQCCCAVMAGYCVWKL